MCDEISVPKYINYLTFVMYMLIIYIIAAKWEGGWGQSERQRGDREERKGRAWLRKIKAKVSSNTSVLHSENLLLHYRVTYWDS